MQPECVQELAVVLPQLREAFGREEQRTRFAGVSAEEALCAVSDGVYVVRPTVYLLGGSGMRQYACASHYGKSQQEERMLYQDVTHCAMGSRVSAAYSIAETPSFRKQFIWLICTHSSVR